MFLKQKMDGEHKIHRTIQVGYEYRYIIDRSSISRFHRFKISAENCRSWKDCVCTSIMCVHYTYIHNDISTTEVVGKH